MPAQAPLIALVTGAVLTLTALGVLGEDRVSAEYGVAAGRDIRDSTITIGLTPEQVREMMLAISQQESPAQAKIDQLSQRLDATHEAVVGFLKILDRNEVPLEKLPETLAQIAQRHREMLERLAALNPEDPAAKALIEQARALLRSANTESDYDRADQLLAQAETLELAAVRMAEDLARQAQEATNRRRLNAAAARAERGELELTRLNYLEAAQHFKAASATVPASDAQARGEYLNRYAGALYRQGDEKGDNVALLQAIAVYREALQEYTRERVPLDWAATQMNLGVALWRLGEREPGTERLEQAVAAYREALKEWTRERVPLQWAATQMNLGTALKILGERESGTGRLQEARLAIEAAYVLYREAGYSQYNAYLEERLKSLDQLIATRSSLTPVTP